MTETLSFSHDAPEKVKAVAAAIYAAIAARKSSFDVARAAIEAMMEPTEHMSIALQRAYGAVPGPVFAQGAEGIWVWGCGVAAALGAEVRPLTGREYTPKALPAFARAMIQAALTEGTGE